MMTLIAAAIAAAAPAAPMAAHDAHAQHGQNQQGQHQQGGQGHDQHKGMGCCTKTADGKMQCQMMSGHGGQHGGASGHQPQQGQGTSQ